MTVVGAISAAAAVSCLVLASRGRSDVERTLGAVAGMRVDTVVGRFIRAGRHRDVARDERLVMAKVACAVVGCVAGIVIAVVSGAPPVVAVVTTYAGFIAPSLAEDRRVARERRAAAAGAVSVVEWVHALVASGRPLEPAVLTLATHPTGSTVLDRCLAASARDYTLGVPMHVALARNGADFGVPPVIELASRLERSRDLGRGALTLLRDLRDDLRASERARTLESASGVEGKLTLVLTLCYLPALALLVIIPLFLTLLSGLLGT